jgi:CubicO group peptidase (beta-lactamase class C family)
VDVYPKSGAGSRLLRSSAICIAVWFAALSSSSAQTSANTSDPVDAPAIEVIVRRELGRRNLPGAALAVTRGGRVVQVSGYGQDSGGRPVTRDTPFYIASTSKAMTAVAVMQLVDAGRIDLDAPIRRYLPEFSLDDPRVERITVRQLLNHTSGMWEVGFRQWSFPQPDSLRAAVARLKPARLAADPGEEHRYFNPNYSVAARLVEEVSGETFDAYLRNRLFAPLGMSATKTVDFIDEARDGPARGYVFAFGHRIRAPGGPFFINGAGGVVSTAADMAQWVAAQANGGVAPNGARMLSPEALRQTHTPSSTSRGYAFGWNVYPDGRISHSGGLTTYSAYVAFFEGGDGIVVLTPGFDSNAPRNIALAVLAHLQGKQPLESGPALMPKLDVAAATLLALNWLFTVWVLARTKVWVRRRRPVWRTVLGLALYAFVAGAVLIGLPNLVGQAIPWSWIWLGYYYPIWTLLLLSLACTASLILTIRMVAYLRNRGTMTSSTFMSATTPR